MIDNEIYDLTQTGDEVQRILNNAQGMPTPQQLSDAFALKANASDVYTKNETYTKTEVNRLVGSPDQNYITVEDYASLPDTGSTDTIYRVANYDGENEQVDVTMYSEYAWNGTSYTLLCVKSQIGEVFDISDYNDATYADLSAALGVDGANVPQPIRRGGMSIKFIQSIDNKYVQYRLMSQTFSTTESDWQGIDELAKTVEELEEDVATLTTGANISLREEVPGVPKKWENVDGKVVLSDSSSVHASHPVDILEYIHYEVTSNVQGLSVQDYFITDLEGNVLKTERESSLHTFIGSAPEGAAKIYINTVNMSSISLILGENVFESLFKFNSKKTFNDLVEIVPNLSNLVYKNVGDMDYLTGAKKFIVIEQSSPLLYREISQEKGTAYVYNNHLFYWNGTDIVPAMTEQVIKLYKIATSAPVGISKGEYYFNLNTKMLYRNNGSLYNSTEIPLRQDTVYIYNNGFYVWNGTDLVSKDVEVATAIEDTVNAAKNETLDKYAARIAIDNTQPFALTETDFESGNLQGNTGDEIPDTKVIRSGFIEVVSGFTISRSTLNNYRSTLFQFDENKSWVANDGFQTGSVNVVLNKRTSFIRICIASPSGVQTAPVWSEASFEATPSKIYAYARAAAEETVNESIDNYFNLELPIFAPSPQLPANDESNSDFNIETVTSTELHTAFENLISKLSAPSSGSYYSSKILNRYEVSGIDASNTYPIYTYSFGTRNRYAWRYSDELYAWKNGSTVVYIDSCCPRQGDTIYSDAARTNSGKTVASYNSSTGVMVDSSNTEYTRDKEANVDADIVWTKFYISKNATTSTTLSAYDRSDTFFGSASVIDSNHVSINSKTYTRSECFDYDTNHKMTVFIWANEHGPTSDPLECSVILYRMIKDLTVGCKNNPFLSFLKEYCKIVFIPCANPWGAQYPRVNGRVNSNGVNINRNYDTPGWSVQSDSDKGSAAGSENETQYIMNMCNRFKPDIAIDMHCLGFGNPIAEGLMYFSETAIPNNHFYQKMQKALSGYGFLFDQLGDPHPNEGAHGSEWLYFNGVIGGVFEMNAGAYSNSSHTYNGKQHTSVIMEADYTELLNCLRCWIAQFDGSINLSKMCIK